MAVSLACLPSVQWAQVRSGTHIWCFHLPCRSKGLWGKHAPMYDEEYLVQQADMVIAANKASSGGTRVGVYRNTIKALNWFTYGLFVE